MPYFADDAYYFLKFSGGFSLLQYCVKVILHRTTLQAHPTATELDSREKPGSISLVVSILPLGNPFFCLQDNNICIL